MSFIVSQKVRDFDTSKLSDPSELLRSVVGRVSKKVPAEWLTPDVLQGAVISFCERNWRKWSEVVGLTVCRHENWNNLCNTCYDVLGLMMEGVVYSNASVTIRHKQEANKILAEEERLQEEIRAKKDVERVNTERSNRETLKEAEREFYGTVVSRLEKADVQVMEPTLEGHYEQVTVTKNLWKCNDCGLVWSMRHEAESCGSRSHQKVYTKTYGVRYYENGRPIGGYTIHFNAIRKESPTPSPWDDSN